MRYQNSLFTVLTLSAISAANHVHAQDVSIIGSWRGQYAESCAAVKEGSTEDFLKISKKTVERYEGECEITRQVAKADRHELQILCETEGEVVRDTIKIEVINRDQININGAGRYDRCN
jgi:hypothetical protein